MGEGMGREEGEKEGKGRRGGGGGRGERGGGRKRRGEGRIPLCWVLYVRST